VATVNPFATLPFQMTSGLARMLSGIPIWPEAPGGGAPPPPRGPGAATPPPEGAPETTPPAAPPSSSSEVADLRRELAELKEAIKSTVGAVAGKKRKPRQ
jgi:hypothetical protein